jgi:hypothetical protein
MLSNEKGMSGPRFPRQPLPFSFSPKKSRLTLFERQTSWKWFQNLQSLSRSREDETFNSRNTFSILRIELLLPTLGLRPRGGFETISS